MKLFISGTDTNIGKTLISSWLCLHSQFDYFKPIQTGCIEDRDSQTVLHLSGTQIHEESYLFKRPLSPHLAAGYEDKIIELNQIQLPKTERLIIEGAGGLMVPINHKTMMIDFIQSLKIPVILVASSRLGTINHSLLSIEALKNRGIPLLGVILSGPLNQDNADSISDFSQYEILAQFPFITDISRDTLQNIPLTTSLKKIMKLI